MCTDYGTQDWDYKVILKEDWKTRSYWRFKKGGSEENWSSCNSYW